MDWKPGGGIFLGGIGQESITPSTGDFFDRNRTIGEGKGERGQADGIEKFLASCMCGPVRAILHNHQKLLASLDYYFYFTEGRQGKTKNWSLRGLIRYNLMTTLTITYPLPSGNQKIKRK